MDTGKCILKGIITLSLLTALAADNDGNGNGILSKLLDARVPDPQKRTGKILELDKVFTRLMILYNYALE